MRKLAITYYYNMMGNPSISCVDIHSSGKEATEFLVKECSRYFHPKPIWKTKPRLSKDGIVTAGFPHRKMIARFLNEQEVEVYKKYGEESYIDYKTQLLIEPPSVTTEKEE